MNHFVIISGCSGGGKSTLLTELKRRGHAVVEEPGRRIIQEETRSGGPQGRRPEMPSHKKTADLAATKWTGQYW
ncbi:AAA family ATPase [Brenneria tiliae]|uniref:AAA family ATPase n=2 Tax=Brenneria tiliae TaxID=2914984 RepID=A0ABT0MRX3_9GAMM|nr:AAA family ATPase [Brenneria tiliae]MCL2892590.1 AAA family ATPase [Brenneria tiliae]